MFLRDDYKFEDELKTLNSVEEAIREARRYRRIFYGMLWGSVVLWVGLVIWMPLKLTPAPMVVLPVYVAAPSSTSWLTRSRSSSARGVATRPRPARTIGG